MLNAEHLRKQFTTVLAVDDVSLEVERGKIFGLIGPNGAGKSTTIRMLLNIITPDSGAITFDGKPFNEELRNIIGYLPEERGLYKKNGVLDTICYFAELRGIASAEARKKGMQWLERFGLQHYAKRKTEELSKGNQQKVQFITSILHNPELVVLDEPFSGLDPVNQILMKDIFQELKQQGKAVIFSTHQMDSAEKLCDELCLINKGKIVLEGTVKEVKQKFGTNALHVEYDGKGAFISSLSQVKKATIYENYAEIILNDGVHSKEIISAISAELELRKFEFVEPSLNSIFLEVVGVPDVKENAEIEKPALSDTKMVSKDPRVKKAFNGILINAAALIIIFSMLGRELTEKWYLPAIIIAGFFFSLFKFIKTKKEVANELNTMKGGVQ